MTPRRTTRHHFRGEPKESFMAHLLDPIDRLAETIYSILVLLTFTLAFRIFNLEPGQMITDEYVNELLTGAIIAIIAWGTIDGIVYLVTEVFERGEKHRFQLIRAFCGQQSDRLSDKTDERWKSSPSQRPSFKIPCAPGSRLKKRLPGCSIRYPLRRHRQLANGT
ncbi:MAG: hypothetical protein R6X18_19030 [Chloroflexota bacterium]|jgi:hypothetical protein